MRLSSIRMLTLLVCLLLAFGCSDKAGRDQAGIPAREVGVTPSFDQSQSPAARVASQAEVEKAADERAAAKRLAREEAELRAKKEADLRRKQSATLQCWRTYLSTLKTHKSDGYDKYEGLDSKLAEIDTLMVDKRLRDHLTYHIQWIKGIRRTDGSPIDLVSTLLEKGQGAFSEGAQGPALIAELKKRCLDVRAELSETYEITLDRITSFGPLPVVN